MIDLTPTGHPAIIVGSATAGFVVDISGVASNTLSGIITAILLALAGFAWRELRQYRKASEQHNARVELALRAVETHLNVDPATESGLPEEMRNQPLRGLVIAHVLDSNARNAELDRIAAIVEPKERS